MAKKIVTPTKPHPRYPPGGPVEQVEGVPEEDEQRRDEAQHVEVVLRAPIGRQMVEPGRPVVARFPLHRHRGAH